MNQKCPNTEPWETPNFTIPETEFALFQVKICYNDLTTLTDSPTSPYSCSFAVRISCKPQSKARVAKQDCFLILRPNNMLKGLVSHRYSSPHSFIKPNWTEWWTENGHWAAIRPSNNLAKTELKHKINMPKARYMIVR